MPQPDQTEVQDNQEPREHQDNLATPDRMDSQEHPEIEDHRDQTDCPARPADQDQMDDQEFSDQAKTDHQAPPANQAEMETQELRDHPAAEETMAVKAHQVDQANPDKMDSLAAPEILECRDRVENKARKVLATTAHQPDWRQDISRRPARSGFRLWQTGDRFCNITVFVLNYGQ